MALGGPEGRPFYTAVDQGNWDLHRKGETDRARHKDKIKDILKANLPGSIAGDDLITGDGSGTYRVRVDKGKVEIPTFRFKRGQQDGMPGGAGLTPGIDWYEVDLTYDEIVGLMFDDLGLPYLEPKDEGAIEAKDVQWTDRRRRGPWANFDKKASAKANITRNARQGNPAKIGNWQDEDLRFKAYEPVIVPDTNAVLIDMMDVSGSMGIEERYIVRAVTLYEVMCLRRKYKNVEVAFITYHTEAKEATEKEFFTKGESGGTTVSSGLELALDWIEGGRYPPSKWNIYPLLFSDGLNWTEDNQRCAQMTSQLLSHANLFCYGEIRSAMRHIPLEFAQYYDATRLMGAFSKIIDPKFIKAILHGRDDIGPTIRAFLPGDTREGREGRV